MPSGFKRIRHYGLLAPAAKTQRLALARSLLAMPAANAQAREDAQAFMRRVAAIDIGHCAHCQLGRWQLVQALPADLAQHLLRSCPPLAEARHEVLHRFDAAELAASHMPAGACSRQA